ncbi:hypothetical protein AHAS_Ahas13G0529700 [Arachis hypogaea]
MNNSTVVKRFSEFYDNWICKLEEIFKQLLHVSNQHNLLIEHDIQSLAYLWITNWKPSTAFKVLESLKKSNLFEIIEEQERKIMGLKMRMRMEEEKVERKMER